MVLHLLPGAWVAWQESGAMRFYNGDHSDCEWMGKRGGERERVTVGETQKEEEEKDGERITERKEKTDGEREREREMERRPTGVYLESEHIVWWETNRQADAGTYRGARAKN